MVRFLTVVAAILTLCVPVTASAFSQSAIDTGWRFIPEDVAGAAMPEFDDHDWRKVTLPHNAASAAGDQATGWYRKHLDLRTVTRGDRVYLQFDGAALTSEVFVNGQSAGRHDGPYSRFRFDITRLLKAGDNVIAVKTDRGGLYRGVSLIQARDIGIDWLDHGTDGVTVTSALTLNSHADLKVAVALRNQRTRAVKMTVNTRIFSREGTMVMQMTRNIRLRAGEAQTLELAGRMVQPKLWNGRRDPYLYAAVTEISDGNETQERMVTHFGIRQVQIDDRHRFWLNGQPYPLMGVNLDTARPVRGQAVSGSDIAEDFDLLDDLGVTAVRVSPAVQAQAVYQEADRRGIVLVSGLPEGSSVEQGREMVRQNRNHPSLVVWETKTATDAALVAAEDPARLSLSQVAADHPALPSAGKPVGFAFTPEASVNEAATLSAVVDAFHAVHVGYPVAILEYGTSGSIRQPAEAVTRIDPASGVRPEAFQAAFHEMAWAHLRARPAVWASFVRQAFDTAATARDDGDETGLDGSGLITADRRTKKDAFWYYKAQWSAQPFVYVAGRRFYERTGRVTQVKVYSNQPSVSLTVNGVVVGTQTVQGGVARFDHVPLSMGMNSVRAESGPNVDEVRWMLKSPVPILQN